MTGAGQKHQDQVDRRAGKSYYQFLNGHFGHVTQASHTPDGQKNDIVHGNAVMLSDQRMAQFVHDYNHEQDKGQEDSVQRSRPTAVAPEKATPQQRKNEGGVHFDVNTSNGQQPPRPTHHKPPTLEKYDRPRAL